MSLVLVSDKVMGLQAGGADLVDGVTEVREVALPQPGGQDEVFEAQAHQMEMLPSVWSACTSDAV